jgi:hypothetical protein
MGRYVLTSLKKELDVEAHVAAQALFFIVRLEFEITFFLNARTGNAFRVHWSFISVLWVQYAVRKSLKMSS